MGRASTKRGGTEHPGGVDDLGGCVLIAMINSDRARRWAFFLDAASVRHGWGPHIFAMRAGPQRLPRLGPAVAGALGRNRSGTAERSSSWGAAYALGIFLMAQAKLEGRCAISFGRVCWSVRVCQACCANLVSLRSPVKVVKDGWRSWCRGQATAAGVRANSCSAVGGG